MGKWYKPKNYLPSKVNHHIDKAGGGSSLLAWTVPGASLYTTTGRAALAKTPYAAMAQGYLSQMNPTAGGVFSSVVERFADAGAAPSEGGSGGGGGGGYVGGVTAAQSSASIRFYWIIAAAVVFVALTLVIVFRRK